jgi:hypothetical protein
MIKQIAVLALTLTLVSGEEEVIVDEGVVLSPNIQLVQPTENVSWYIHSNLTVNLTTTVELSTNWTIVTPTKGIPKGTAMKIKEVGTIHTNRYVHMSLKGKTNSVIVEVIGVAEWPTEQRERKVRLQ